MFCRADAGSGKFSSVSLRYVLLDPDQRECAESCLFFLLRKVLVWIFDGVEGAKPPRGAGRSPDQVSQITECLPVVMIAALVRQLRGLERLSTCP